MVPQNTSSVLYLWANSHCIQDLSQKTKASDLQSLLNVEHMAASVGHRIQLSWQNGHRRVSR